MSDDPTSAMRIKNAMMGMNSEYDLQRNLFAQHQLLDEMDKQAQETQGSEILGLGVPTSAEILGTAIKSKGGQQLLTNLGFGDKSKAFINNLAENDFNVKGLFQDTVNNVKDKVTDLKNQAMDQVDNLQSQAENQIGNVRNQVSGLQSQSENQIGNVRNQVSGLQSQAENQIGNELNNARNVSSGLTDAGEESISSLRASTQGLMANARSNLSNLFSRGHGMMTDFKNPKVFSLNGDDEDIAPKVLSHEEFNANISNAPEQRIFNNIPSDLQNIDNNFISSELSGAREMTIIGSNNIEGVQNVASNAQASLSDLASNAMSSVKSTLGTAQDNLTSVANQGSKVAGDVTGDIGATTGEDIGAGLAELGTEEAVGAALDSTGILAPLGIAIGIGGGVASLVEGFKDLFGSSDHEDPPKPPASSEQIQLGLD